MAATPSDYRIVAPRKDSRHLLGLLLAVLLGGAAAAQQGTFRSSVEVIVIDVSVADGSGRPVSDLTASDFRVSVDRKPRQIVSAQFLSYAMRLPKDVRLKPDATSARPDPDVRLKPDATTAAPAGRDILIVVDEDSMDGGTGLVARRALEQFIDRLAPADRAGVTTIPRLRSSVSLTTNRGDVRKAVRQVLTGRVETSGGLHSIGVSEALAIERGDEYVLKAVVDRECHATRVDDDCVKEVVMEAHQIAIQTRLRSQRSTDALQQLADGLAQFEGAKTMVLVSGGLPMPESTESFSRLSAAFARGQVSLYTIFIQSPIQGRADRQSPSALDDERVEADGIENITSAAGGGLVRAIGTVESSLDRVASELSGSYLLAIEVTPADRDGRPHNVQVRVERPGVVVRARQQYVIAPPTPPKSGVVLPGDRAREAKAARAKAREIEVTPPEVAAVVAKASLYVREYETKFSGLVAEERYDQALSRLKSRGTVTARELVQRNEWSLEAKRELKSDYLLVKAPEIAGWLPFRDVFEVDGQKVRERDLRLQKLFLEAPASAWDRATEIVNESARFNVGYTRNVNLPTLALMFLHPDYRDRFVYRKSGEATVEGIAVWQVDYREQARPTLVRNSGADLPAQGTFWIDPADGRVVRTAVKFAIDVSSAETIVSYRPNDKLGGIWVPAEMRETMTAGDMKLDCLAQYSNFRRFQVTTDVQIPK